MDVQKLGSYETAAEHREASDQRLMEGVVARDDQAMVEICRRFEPILRAFCARLLMNPALAEDVAQEVLWHLWTDADRFDCRRGSLRAYLLSRAYGRSIDVLRSESARRRREQRTFREAERSGDVENEVVGRLEADRTRAALAELPTGERDAITLAFLGGATYRDVARLLGQPEGTVKARIRSGLVRLRSALAPVEAFDPLL